MSTHASSIVWRWALPPAERVVALYLADGAGDDGAFRCTPLANSQQVDFAVAAVAQGCGLPKVVVKTAIEALLAKGCIVALTERENGRLCPTAYALNLAWERSAP